MMHKRYTVLVVVMLFMCGAAITNQGAGLWSALVSYVGYWFGTTPKNIGPSLTAWCEQAGVTGAEIIEWLPDVRSAQPLEASTWLACFEQYEKVHHARLTAAQWLPPYTPDAKHKKSVAGREGHYYAQRITVQPSARLFIFGDTHGDLFAVCSFLKAFAQDGGIDEQWRLTRPHDYLVFLGDNIDRGAYGAEVLYTLMRLVIANPDRVWLTRGNHEDLNMSAHHGFDKEIKGKYSFTEYQVIRKSCGKLFDDLALVLYVDNGTSVVQCCHGGFELGYSPIALLGKRTDPKTVMQSITGLYRAVYVRGKKPEEIARFLNTFQIANDGRIFTDAPKPRPGDFGFLWNDFDASGTEQTRFNDQRKIGLRFGKTLTEFMMHMQTDFEGSLPIALVIRGHQHNVTMPPLLFPMAKGTYAIWDKNQVITTIATQMFVSFSQVLFSGVCLEPRIDGRETMGWQVRKLYGQYRDGVPSLGYEDIR